MAIETRSIGLQQKLEISELETTKELKEIYKTRMAEEGGKNFSKKRN